VSVRRRSRLPSTVVIAALSLAAAGPTTADQAEVRRYYEATRDICRTGETPAIVAAYEEARRAMARLRPPGQDGNFAGMKSPAAMWLDCFQSPGDGKT
jgi:hypothetical protein